MSESSQASRPPKDSVRIVYHAGNRTFARLFNERSLEEVKDVVRRKLALGAETDVSLKQMGSGALLDLEDDGDFQAFRVFLKSSVSVDIEVTVGRSQGSTVPPPVAPQPPEHPSASKSTTTTSAASPSREPAGVATSSRPTAHPEVARTTEVSITSSRTPLAPKRKVPFDHGDVAASDKPTEQRSGQPSAHPEAARSTEASTTPAKTPLARKRKVSFDHGNTAASDKPTLQRPLAQPIAITPVASAKATESPALKPVGAEEPPKKKRKKEPTKKKEVQATETVESAAMKPLAPKAKPKRSTTLDRGSKAGTSAPKDTETAEPPAKKLRKQKKDDSTGPRKSSAPVDQDGMDQPISEPSSPVSEASLPLAVEKPSGSSVEGGTLRTRKSEKTKTPTGTACAAIPQTSASVSVQSEVAAAILSGYLSKASETIPPEPPKRKSVKRDTKKSAASSSALPGEPTTALDVPANETPNIPTERRPKRVVLTNEPPRQTPDLNGPPCPICLGEPFHIRYYCPTVLKGPGAIRERLEELNRTNVGDQQSLIHQLEGLLRDSKVTSEPSLDGDDVQSGKVSPPPNASPPRTPNIPSNSCLSEVTVESRDEGSSSESSDEMSEGRVEHQELSAPQRRKSPDGQPLPSNDDLEALIRGPTSKRQSILNLLDRIVGDEDDEASNSEEESRSPSLSRSAEDTPNNLGPAVQSSNKSAEESAEHQEEDVVMRDSVNPPVLEGHDDSSEETHVGLEDRMVVDESTGEKGAAIVAEEQPSSPVPRAPVLRPSDAPSNEPQESAKIQVDPTPNRNGSVQVASEVLEGVEVDPIEPADDLTPPSGSRSPNADPIEAPSDNIGSLFASATQSTPKPGVSKRIKTRNGEILDDEAERPVLLEQLASVSMDEVTPIPARAKPRRKVTEMPASQEPASTRKSPRFSSVPPSTSTPAAVVLLNRRSKSGTRTGKATKTPAKEPEERSDTLKNSSKDDIAQNGARIASTPSLIKWETLAEPSSPSPQQDEPSVFIDELMSSSPRPDDILVRGRLNDKEKKGRPRKPAASSQAESSQGKERLFDLSSSQIPFPYSQNQTNLEPAVLPNGEESEGTTDSEEEPKVTKKNTKMPVRYRSLSQLASRACLFSPSFPTPVNKSMPNGKEKKRAADEDSSSSSSSSSDADEANGSEHIPRERRAGSALKTKKSLLSRI